MTRPTPQTSRTVLLRVAGIVVLVSLALAVWLQPVNPLHRAAQNYLETATDGAMKGFLSLSGIKVGLAMIEGSEIGVNIGVKASLQAGDIVQSAYDYVDVAWRAMLAASIVLLASQHLLDAADVLDHWCFALTILVVLTLFLVKSLPRVGVRTQRILTDAAAFLAVLTVCLYAVLPLSFLGGGALSEVITQPSIAAAETGLKDLGSELFPELPENENPSTVDRLKQAQRRIKEVAVQLRDRSVELVEWVVRIIAGYVFDTIVFPAAVFLLLFYLTKLCTKYMFGLRQSRIFREDLGMVLAEHADALDSESRGAAPAPAPRR